MYNRFYSQDLKKIALNKCTKSMNLKKKNIIKFQKFVGYSEIKYNRELNKIDSTNVNIK